MLHPIYYIIMFIITIGSYIEFSTKKNLKQLFIFICIILVIIAGIRVGQGADYWPYFGLYMSSSEYVQWNQVFDKSLGIEPTYVIISKIFGSLHLPFTFLLLTFAFLSITLKAKIILRYSPLPMFSLLLLFMPGFFAGDMGHIRQSLSTSICLFSFHYIASKKLYKYLICLYFAYLTHKTAMIFFPAYFIANMNISTIKAFFIVLLGIISMPLELYNILGAWLNDVSDDNLATTSFNSYSNMEGIGASLTDIVKIFFIIIIFLNDSYIIKQKIDPNYMKIRNLVITFIFMFYFFHGNAIFASRLSAVYQIFEIILIAMLVKYSKKGSIYYIYFVLYCYLISWRFWENAKALEFDHFNNIFNDPRFNIHYFTPHKFANQNIINYDTKTIYYKI